MGESKDNAGQNKRTAPSSYSSVTDIEAVRSTDIMNFIPDAILAIDLEGRVIAWNRAMEALTGVIAADILDKGNYEHSLPLYGTRRPTLADLALKPMNAIIGMTGLLLSANIDSEQRESLEIIRSSGEALLSIINDILDLSKIEGGMMELENQPFNLRGCIEEALDLGAKDASEKGLKLEYEIEEGTPTIVSGDPARLRQILVNLINRVYDVVLMDVLMPDMDGLETTRAIRQRWPNRKGPKIIAMTASALKGDREMCLDAGMDNYISKPVRIEDLAEALRA